MCWYSKKESIKKVAENDVPCFKVVQMEDDGSLVSVYYGKVYKPKRTYKHKNLIPKKLVYQSFNEYRISKGLHSYATDVEITNNCIGTIIMVKGLVPIGRIPLWFSNNYKFAKVNCIIPKGAEYYENEQGEYVSTQLKVIGYEEIDLSYIIGF